MWSSFLFLEINWEKAVFIHPSIFLSIHLSILTSVDISAINVFKFCVLYLKWASIESKNSWESKKYKERFPLVKDPKKGISERVEVDCFLW